MKINKNTIIGDVLDKYPNTAQTFLNMGMHCLGCPASKGETIEQACQVHGNDPEILIKDLKEVIGK